MPAPISTITRTWTHLPFLPGLEATQGPNAVVRPYKTVFFGASHEYADDEGWTKVHYRTLNTRKQRRWRDLNE
jgi:hypothetical protein